MNIIFLHYGNILGYQKIKKKKILIHFKIK